MKGITYYFSPWQFETSADASMKSGDKGSDLGETVSVAVP